MTTWEHKHLQAVDEDKLEATLNRWGAQGWAVASIISWRPARAKVNVVLTRPTPQDAPVSYGVTEEDLRNAKLDRQPWMLREVEPPLIGERLRAWQENTRERLRRGLGSPYEPGASGEGIEPSQPALEASSPAEEHGRPREAPYVDDERCVQEGRHLRGTRHDRTQCRMSPRFRDVEDHPL